MTTNFSQFGKTFQEKLVQALLVDAKWAEQMSEVIDINFFDVKYLQFLADRYFAYSKKYKVFPTMELLLGIIKDDLRTGNDTILRDYIVEYLMRIRTNPDMGDLGYVKEKSLEFCRKQALKRAIETAVDQLQENKYENIVEGIRRATLVGTTPSVGHNFFDEIDARFTKQRRSAIPTGISELDKKDILNGGSGKGELHCVIAASGVGKSHFLTMIGCNALRQGKNVLHYTFELAETLIGVRYDSNLAEIDASDVYDNQVHIEKVYAENKAIFGRLFIKEYPPNFATVGILKAHLERLMLKENFKPDIVIIDYADIMRSAEKFEQTRMELKRVYEELRALAMDLQIPIWTASQSNREGADAEIVDMTNMSESYGKAMICDLIVSLSRRSKEKSTGFGRLYIAKNRAGKDGILFSIKIDTARSKIEIISNSETEEEFVSNQEKESRKSLRDKWNQLKKDFD